MTQIVDQTIAGQLRKRQTIDATDFVVSQRQYPITPIDRLQIQLCNFMTTQRHVDKTTSHGIVTFSDRGGTIKSGPETSQLLVIQCRWQGRQQLARR